MCVRTNGVLCSLACSLCLKLASMKQLGVELRHLEAENRDLKARIERQEAFHKRKMEKEKKDKRIRSGPAGSSRAPPVGGAASGECGVGGIGVFE